MEGHQRLAGYLEDARGEPAPERLRAMGRAYFRFGAEQPADFDLMFHGRPGAARRRDAVQREMFTLLILRDVVVRGIDARRAPRRRRSDGRHQRPVGRGPRGDRAARSSGCWSRRRAGTHDEVLEAVLDGALRWLARARAPVATSNALRDGRRPPPRPAPPTGPSPSPPRDARAASRPTRSPPGTAHRWPFRALDDPAAAEPRRRLRRSRSRRSSARCATWATTSASSRSTIPRIAHERDEVPLGLPARALARLPDRRGEQGRDAVALPADARTHELYSCEERLWEMGHRTVKLINALGGEGLTTTIGWPQEVGQRWADKIWPLSHKLVAQAAGLGVIGTSRNFLHRTLRRVLPDRHRASPTSSGRRTTGPIDWNPCLQCNLCVASCPTEAIHAGRRRSTSSPATTTPTATRSPASSTWCAISPSARRASSASAGPTTRSPALWQALSFKVEYRCFNCVATCPAEIEHAFHDDRDVASPLPRRDAEAAHAHARRRGRAVRHRHAQRARAPRHPARRVADADRPRRALDGAGVRLVSLRRIRTQNVDAMMRWMPQYFRPTEARGLAFTTQFELTGPGGGDWAMRIGDRALRGASGHDRHARPHHPHAGAPLPRCPSRRGEPGLGPAHRAHPATRPAPPLPPLPGALRVRARADGAASLALCAAAAARAQAGVMPGFADRTAIVGVGETDYVRGADELPVELMLRAARDAIADAGLDARRHRRHHPAAGLHDGEELAANLGIATCATRSPCTWAARARPRRSQHAAMAVDAGHRRRRARRRRLERLLRVPPEARRARAPPRPRRHARSPTSSSTSTCRTARCCRSQFYAWIATRHKQLYGVPDEATGAVAVACREHAQLNPKRADARDAAHDGRVPRGALGLGAVPALRLLARDRLRGRRRRDDPSSAPAICGSRRS